VRLGGGLAQGRQAVGQGVHAGLRIAVQLTLDGAPDVLGRLERGLPPGQGGHVVDLGRAHRHFLDGGDDHAGNGFG
jgi:hypothetical protein